MNEGFRNEAANFAKIGRLHGRYLTMVACLEQRAARQGGTRSPAFKIKLCFKKVK
jgi:hypothetical protein